MTCVMVSRAWENYVRTLTCALVLGLAIGFSGCKKKEVAEEAPEEAPAATPTPKPATPEPKIAVATPTPIPATPAPQFAPPGVFYLLTSVSVETSDGILGLKPGQLLKQVRPGVYKADNNEVTLRPEQVTNDLTIARKVAVQDQQTQAAIQQHLAASAAAAAAAASSASAPSGSTPSGSPASSFIAKPALPPNVAARQELALKKQALMQQQNQLATTINQAASKYGGNWDASSKKSPVVFQLVQQWRGLQNQIDEVTNQMNQIP